MESNTVMPLQVLSTDREGETEDKAIQSNQISKQTEPMSNNQSATEISTLNASNNMNQFSDKNEINMFDDDDQIPNIYVQCMDKADFGHTQDNSTHITDTISGLSKPTQTVHSETVEEGAPYVSLDNYKIWFDNKLSEVDISNKTEAQTVHPQTVEEGAPCVSLDNYKIWFDNKLSKVDISNKTEAQTVHPQTVEEGAPYISLDNYKIWFDNKLSEVDISNKTEAVSIKLTNTGITKQMEEMPTRLHNAGISKPNVSGNAPQIHKRIIDLNDVVNLPSVYIDKAGPDGVTTHDNSRQINIYEDIIDKAEPDGVSMDIIVYDEPDGVSIDIIDKAEPDGVSIDIIDKAEPDGVSIDIIDKAEPDDVSIDKIDKAEPDGVSMDIIDKAEPDDVSIDIINKAEPDGVSIDIINKAEPDGVSIDIIDKAEPDGVSIDIIDKAEPDDVSIDKIDKAEPDGVSIDIIVNDGPDGVSTHDNNRQIDIYEDIIDMSEPDGVSIDIIDKAELDSVSTHDNNRHIDIYEDITDRAEPGGVSMDIIDKAEPDGVSMDIIVYDGPDGVSTHDNNRQIDIYEDIIDMSEPDGVSIDMLDKAELDSVSTHDNNRHIDIYEDMNEKTGPDGVSIDMIDKAEPDSVSTHDNNRHINIYEDITDRAEPGGVSIDIKDKAEPDGMSTRENNTHISSTNQLDQTSSCKGTNTKKKMKTVQPHIMTNKCKLALALLVGLVITVSVVSVIVWSVKASRYNRNKKKVPAISLTSTSPGNQKKTANIGFTAWATSVLNYSAGTTLIFNGIDERDEEHNGFDRGTGLFTCPKTGIYYVYVTLRKNNLSNIFVDVFKMDSRIIRFLEKHRRSPWNTVSNSALVSCSVGEIIQIKGWGSGSIYGEADVRCSSFSVINMDQIAGNSTEDTFVGYSGYAKAEYLRRGHPINFPNVLCNVGNHFSLNRFKCPYKGIYFVGVTYWKHFSRSGSYRVDAHVNRGNTHRNTTVISSHDYDNSYNYVTNNALVRCNTGEYIETRAGSKSFLYGSGSYPESIFTVMSVHQKDQSLPYIGFSRYKTHRQHYSAGDVITFTGIIMDEGNYFQSNQFVCPVDGSYYFLLNLKKHHYAKIKVSLKHGDQTAFMLEDQRFPAVSNTISNSAVIRCLKGEVVAVVAAGKGEVDHHKRTTFTGFLLNN